MSERHVSPLAHRSPLQGTGNAISLAERPGVNMLNLRADAKAANRALKKASGLALPEKPNTSSHAKQTRILWLGPDEWLLLSDPGSKEMLQDQIEKAFARTHHQLLDVSDQNAVIELSGDKARELLMKLTTLDLHPTVFQPGDVAGSHFGRTTATLQLQDTGSAKDDDAFVLIVRRSYADYLWCLLAKAGREFGLPDQKPQAGEIMRP
ncbi:MAG: sarcosine oxidase subunit gamma family protein [Pseudomonadota bacterium]